MFYRKTWKNSQFYLIISFQMDTAEFEAGSVRLTGKFKYTLPYNNIMIHDLI